MCLSHSHLSRSANPSSFRSGMPSSPWSLGEQKMGPAILHFPPAADWLPVQRKALCLLLISAMAQAKRQQVIEICTSMADSVVYVRVVRPTALSMLAF